jgi:biotin operon repressor
MAARKTSRTEALISLSNQARAILNVLKLRRDDGLTTPTSSYYLASTAGIPVPSVRRAVGELRVAGHTINTTFGRGYALGQ